MSRAEQLRDDWQRIHAQVADSCLRYGRDPASVTVIAVTKGYPFSDIADLAAIGAKDVGESRDDEARRKHDLGSGLGLTWHCIGQVQTNKAAKVAAWADVVHSVDRLRLATALSAAMLPGRRLDVLIQVNTGDVGSGRGGAAPADVERLADEVAGLPGLRLAGLMTVAPLHTDPRAGFLEVSGMLTRLQQSHPEASMLSAGMSEDFDSAIAAGATHLRIGTAILGSRTG